MQCYTVLRNVKRFMSTKKVRKQPRPHPSIRRILLQLPSTDARTATTIIPIPLANGFRARNVVSASIRFTLNLNWQGFWTGSHAHLCARGLRERWLTKSRCTSIDRSFVGSVRCTSVLIFFDLCARGGWCVLASISTYKYIHESRLVCNWAALVTLVILFCLLPSTLFLHSPLFIFSAYVSVCLRLFCASTCCLLLPVSSVCAHIFPSH